MPSLVWGSIFLFLVAELIVTVILVVPVPRKIRHFLAREIFLLDIGDKLTKPVLYVSAALVLALLESYWGHRRITNRMAHDYQEMMQSDHHHYPEYHLHDKEKKYKAERNMYLAGFALTLLLVIGRITKLMQESIELEEETEKVKKGETTSSKEGTKAKADASAGDKKKD
eukprot:CAMPEP_0176143246 /NCGR_PEP_ID=MMETSP0120_2-20121206/72900_1 /TAXON_ID=160619 /ORGANISM="Kryptoperidinium foliaceum, Strain CCMP 1326" /LENGTH=169 /DNA_ID=CAMNT_0017479533 /DNA_START=127 /DNA_END=636 /DNA_ORIENTATION=+